MSATPKVLRALSALAPAPRQGGELDPSDIVWLGMTPNRLGLPRDPFNQVAFGIESPATIETSLSPVGVGGAVLDGGDEILADLAARATLNGSTWLPVSWLTVIGLGTDPDATPFVAPVYRTRAQLVRSSGDATTFPFSLVKHWALRRISDWEFGVEVDDPAVAEHLLDDIPWCGMVGFPSAGDTQLASSPGLKAGLRRLAEAQGWRITRVTGAHPGTIEASGHTSSNRQAGDVTICVGFSILPVYERVATGAGAALLSWSTRPGIEASAFGAIVDSPNAPTHVDGVADTLEVTSHVPLTAEQRRIALSARSSPITVVSGAPGTGKTHTIAAICADAVARGESVLIGTRTIEAADVIAAMLARQPGPVPLRFGSPDAMATAFAEIERRMADHVEGSTSNASNAHADYLTLSDEARELLDTLDDADDAADESTHQAVLRRSAPGCFEPGADLDRLTELHHAAGNAPGFLGSALGRDRRRRRAIAELAATVGAPCDDPERLALVADATALARAMRSIGEAPEVSQRLQALWPAWEDAEKAHRYWTGKALDHLTLERLSSPPARAALTTINTALRSGPSSRQRLLSTLDRRAFRDAAPIWLGTLGEIERLLPQTAGWFDLVVIDEASQVDVALAAPALLRGARGVVLGDPRQLRHVSFVGDDDVEAVFAAEGVDAEIGQLNLRRNSVFDVAASVAPVNWLDEHHRSLPHLVQFSLDEFYDRPVTISTRFPTTECRDCIDVIEPQRSADDSGTVRAVIKRLRELHRSGADDVGVVTPLRELADQTQEAALVELGHEIISKLHLMITTVHGFQGAERKHIIVVPGVGETSPPGRRRFVEDPHLFNVMVSRARQRMDVVTTVEPDDRTLLGRFVTWSHHPPPPAPSTQPTYRSAIELGKALTDAGVDVRYRYPVGSHDVDVVVRHGERVVGIMCGVHPNGPDAHLARHLALRLTGWRLIDLIPPLDDTARAAMAIEIAGDLRS